MQRQRAQPNAPLAALDYAIAQGHAHAYRLAEADAALARVPESFPAASVLRAELLWGRRHGAECAESVTNALARAVELVWPAAMRARLLHVRAECLVPTDAQRAFREAQAAREAYRSVEDLIRASEPAASSCCRRL